MQHHHTTALAHAYWASHLGCPADELFAEPLRLITHGGELCRYRGVFALFRDGAAMISFPPDLEGILRPLLGELEEGCDGEDIAAALDGAVTAVIGPAFIGYADSVDRPAHPVRELGAADAAQVEELRSSCELLEWEHGGSTLEHPCSGVFIGGCLVALAGYEVWGGTIAHISIITHPGFRGHGYGRSAVAHSAARAAADGLLPQYRTLQRNAPSMRVAEQLGFRPFASSVALRLDEEALG